ncbi:MAG: hypothetical protein ETSY2_16575 [Candidatus Entotheonella gemina]|uniref:FAD dependent oxidoreductase domain-containing protein n=1 Tax=Candidatus Entotheonella gemina TaxID=1429439 RepID=W4M832_9BACT|nr:MAG: hypothetical protein ETSY2_16575 [Candidatus Entotheonella gemina]
MDTADIVIAGGGMAGASMAYFLVQQGAKNIVLLEREATLAHHSSGRSAAINLEWDADPVIRDLQLLSRDFFYDPPGGFTATDAPIFHRTGVLDVAAPDDLHLLASQVASSQAAGIAVECWTPDEVCHRAPLLIEEYMGGGVSFPTAVIVPFTSCSRPISSTPVTAGCRCGPGRRL